VSRRSAIALSAFVFLALATVAHVTDNPTLTGAGTFGAALRLALPIGLAGLGGLWSERAGVVNIGLEGMMILGMWFGAWGGVEHGPAFAVVMGIVGGALGGLLHAIATVWFGVDHIVSGVAINLLGAGAARYLNVIVFEGVPGAGATQSPRVQGVVPRLDLPILSGGDLGGWHSPDVLGWLDKREWFAVSDLAGVLGGATRNVPLVVILGVALVPLSWWILWRTPFGLRLRSVGEDPVAAESLGVDVYRLKTIAVLVSGGLAGLGGAVLVLVQSGIYRENQIAGRGFIGLAAMIFGNWRPGGLAFGAGLFGFFDALRLRDLAAVHAMLLVVAILLAAGAVLFGWGRRWRPAALALAVAGGLFAWWATSDSYPKEFQPFTPHLATLLLLAFASQRLRMPAADGLPYRRGQGR
jgi:simple sugar transport system permease protein